MLLEGRYALGYILHSQLDLNQCEVLNCGIVILTFSSPVEALYPLCALRTAEEN